MNVYIEKRGKARWVVVLRQGNQFFDLALEGTKAESTWVARMFRIALKAHDEEKKI